MLDDILHLLWADHWWSRSQIQKIVFCRQLWSCGTLKIEKCLWNDTNLLLVHSLMSIGVCIASCDKVVSGRRTKLNGGIKNYMHVCVCLFLLARLGHELQFLCFHRLCRKVESDLSNTFPRILHILRYVWHRALHVVKYVILKFIDVATLTNAIIESSYFHVPDRSLWLYFCWIRNRLFSVFNPIFYPIFFV